MADHGDSLAGNDERAHAVAFLRWWADHVHGDDTHRAAERAILRDAAEAIEDGTHLRFPNREHEVIW